MKYFFSFLIIISISCTTQKKKREFQARVNYAGAPTLVYKTQKDYSKNVPVLLNDKKDSIVSYPDRLDLKVGEAFVYPAVLHQGYLLDNRGIGPNVAFLKYTYEEFCKLETPLTENQLFAALLDKNPLQELYDLGSRYQYKNLIDSLNSIIDNGDLKLHKKLK